MVVTFGYITMFASVFVLGAPCIFLFILIESRSDIFRIEETCRRPIPGKTHHIGSWSVIIQLFCFLAIFSNIIISCYASDQMDQILPWLKSYKDDSATAMTTVFCLEHLLLLSIFMLKLLLDKEPEWIGIFLARRSYKSEVEKIRRL